MKRQLFPISKDRRGSMMVRCMSCSHKMLRKNKLPFKCGFCKDNKKIPHNWKNIKNRLFEERGKKCDICGTDKRISVHHVDKDRTNNSYENLRILCIQCHTSLHRNEGKQIKEVYIGSCGVRIIWE